VLIETTYSIADAMPWEVKSVLHDGESFWRRRRSISLVLDLSECLYARLTTIDRASVAVLLLTMWIVIICCKIGENMV
jgi:hypothetical protein